MNLFEQEIYFIKQALKLQSITHTELICKYYTYAIDLVLFSLFATILYIIKIKASRLQIKKRIITEFCYFFFFTTLLSNFWMVLLCKIVLNNNATYLNFLYVGLFSYIYVPLLLLIYFVRPSLWIVSSLIFSILSVVFQDRSLTAFNVGNRGVKRIMICVFNFFSVLCYVQILKKNIRLKKSPSSFYEI